MMGSLPSKAREFLSQTDWVGAKAIPLTQDASTRRYHRLTQTDGTSAIFMDASLAAPDEVERFLSIGHHLRQIGLSAPEIYVESPEYLVLEDFGDARIADLPVDPKDLYRNALDVLKVLQSQPAARNLPVCDAAHLGQLAATAWQWYPKAATGEDSADTRAMALAFEQLSTTLQLAPSCMMLRDYHAENLMWLPDRKGARRAGVLDFQDAMLGHPAFDVVSLLQDARRDIAPDFESVMCGYFLDITDLDKDLFATAYAALGTIRNLRIIGMFARLARLLGRPDYIDFIPRVWSYLARDLAHPALKEARALVAKSLPEPTSDHLNFLRASCPQTPPQ